MTNCIGRIAALLVCMLLALPRSEAQDIMMARGNAQLTLSMSPVNFYRYGMNSGMSSVDGDYKRFEYTLNFSKPLSITAEYAVGNGTTIGINANYFRYSLSEMREDALGIQTAATTGSHLDLHLRALRYFFSNSRGSMYLLGELGIRKRSISYSGTEDDVAYINTFPETQRSGYKPLSYDFGIGFHIRIVSQFGISAEYTMLSLAGRYGLFYIFRPAGRRSADQIGW